MQLDAPDHGFEKRFQARRLEALDFSRSLEGPSLMGRLARLPAPVRERVFARLSPLDRARIAYAWEVWARPKQNPDLDACPHRVLFWCSGRGFGKTLSGAQRFKQRHEKGARSGAIVGPTLRKIEQYMIEGTELAPGLLRIYHPSLRPTYLPHKARIDFKLPPGVGGRAPVAYVHSAEDRDFRGTNLDTVWGDEIAEWHYLEALWDNIELSTRARCAIPIEIILTSTPIRRRFIRELVEDPDVLTVFGKTRENKANNDPVWLARMERKLGGTRKGLEELEGEILADNPGALFKATKLDEDRVTKDRVPEGLRVVVAVDPGISVEKGVDPTGIVVVGEDPQTGHMYVLEDLTQDRRLQPEEWGSDVIKAYDRHGAVAIVAERNRGGDLVRANIRAVMREKRGGTAALAIPIEEVNASRGKYLRAEPVSALHEKGLIHLVGALRELEAELTEWSPDERAPSPNRLDAMVYGAYFLGRLANKEDPVDYRAGFRGLEQQFAPPAAGQALRPSGPLAPVLGVRHYPPRRQLR